MDGSDDGGRFQHLLAPIRDLVANWSVDIAAELGDYLDVLEDLTFTLDGEDNKSLNFAEAALVIQGSASIYSRKVEYLHRMVHQALDFIADKKKKDAAGGEDGAEEAERTVDDDIDDFLHLGDELEEGKGIDLDMAHYKVVKRAPRPPAALVAIDDASGLDGNDAVKMAQCFVHASGALIMEGGAGAVEIARLLDLDGTAQRPLEGKWIVNAETNEAMWDDGDDDDDDDGAAAFDQDDAASEWAAAAPAAAGADDPEYDPLQDADGAADSDDEAAMPAARKSAPAVFDPYAPLDPDDPCIEERPPKPFKKGRTYKLPRPDGTGGASKAGAAEAEAGVVAGATLRGLTFKEFGEAYKQMQAAARAARRVDPKTKKQPFHAYGEGAKGADDWDDEDDAAAAAFDDDDWDDDAAAAAGDGSALEDAVEGALHGGSPVRPQALSERFPDDGPVGELSYEQLCRAHLDAAVTAAAESTAVTALAARVSSWRAKVTPALELEDSRPHFDIHHTGQLVVKNAQDSDGCIIQRPFAFGELVAEQPRYMVSRQFAAMLQMLNDGNLAIDRKEGEWTKQTCGQMDVISQFTITCLDLQVRHDAFSDATCGSFGGAALEDAAPLMITDTPHQPEEEGGEANAPLNDENDETVQAKSNRRGGKQEKRKEKDTSGDKGQRGSKQTAKNRKALAA